VLNYRNLQFKGDFEHFERFEESNSLPNKSKIIVKSI
jgi:hypothetical protein